MKKYSEWRPSGFDTAGLGLEDRQDWLVAPVAQNRDSDALERSNFRVVVRDLQKLDERDRETGEESFEIHRFGHWACGWFEIILVQPGSEAEKCCNDWEAALADYPIADESDFSELECEEENECNGTD